MENKIHHKIWNVILHSYWSIVIFVLFYFNCFCSKTLWKKNWKRKIKRKTPQPNSSPPLPLRRPLPGPARAQPSRPAARPFPPFSLCLRGSTCQRFSFPSVAENDSSRTGSNRFRKRRDSLPNPRAKPYKALSTDPRAFTSRFVAKTVP